MDLNKLLELSDALAEAGFLRHCLDGNCMEIKEQCLDLSEFISHYNVKRVLEIGFNTGHSSLVFLESSPYTRVTSFELLYNKSNETGKKFIDTMYPDRHTLLIGDSRVTIPEYIASEAAQKFDLIFIDGGHSYEVAAADLRNCRELAGDHTIVVMDDTIYTKGWEAAYTTGPTQAWEEYLSGGKLKEIARKEYRPCRGMSWGQYI
jgi:predicted O-methyltransferase YrrM